jgi:hypothetical protein
VTAEALKEASVVILANCGAPSDDQFGQLRTFVRDGGGLLILPGDRVTDGACNTRYFPVPGPQNEQLTDAQQAADRAEVCPRSRTVSRRGLEPRSAP